MLAKSRAPKIKTRKQIIGTMTETQKMKLFKKPWHLEYKELSLILKETIREDKISL